MKRAIRAFMALAIVFGGLLSEPGGGLAQDAGTATPDQSGQYVSPDYGYAVAWQPVWSVVEKTAEGGYDLLHLTDGAGDLYVEGQVEYAGDATVCLSTAEQQLQTDSTITHFAVSAPPQPAPGGGESATFTYTQTDKNGPVDVTSSVLCKTLRPGGAVLTVTLVAATSDWPDVSTNAAPVIDEIAMPTQASEADIAQVLADTEADLTVYWTQEFASQGLTYKPPTYVNFDKKISTPCGDANPQDIGPFYCPDNATVYLDLIDIQNSVLPYGLFLVAVVAAHETGHHIEELLNLNYCPKQCANGYSNEQWELMADCFAGGWAKDVNTRGGIDVGGLEDAIVGTAAFLGDPPAAVNDMPSTDAHGPGSLRTWWFLQGYFEGPTICPTINQPSAQATPAAG